MSIRGAPLVLSTGTAEPFNSQAGDGFLDRVIGEAFSRAGHVAVVVRASSSARSLANADSGIDDGLAIRMAGIEKSHRNLLRVPEKLMDNEFVAYSRGLSFPTTGWSSLHSYDVAYVRGWKVFVGTYRRHVDAVLTPLLCSPASRC